MTQTFGNDYFLLGADRDWPHRMFDAAEPMIAKLGGKVVGKQYTLGDEKDFAPLIDADRGDSKAKVLLYALKGDGMEFIPYASERGLFKNTTVAFLGLTEADLKAFGGKGRQHLCRGAVRRRQRGSEGQGVCGAGARQGGTGHGGLELRRDALQRADCVKAAIEKAGKVDKEALVDALEGVTFNSPAGPVTIGKDHHATLDMFLAGPRDRTWCRSRRSARSPRSRAASREALAR